MKFTLEAILQGVNFNQGSCSGPCPGSFVPADPDRGVIDDGLRQLVAAKGHLRILQRIQRNDVSPDQLLDALRGLCVWLKDEKCKQKGIKMLFIQQQEANLQKRIVLGRGETPEQRRISG
jgi:hypothetical protein